jgi:hypothetical protein
MSKTHWVAAAMVIGFGVLMQIPGPILGDRSPPERPQVFDSSGVTVGLEVTGLT